MARYLVEHSHDPAECPRIRDFIMGWARKRPRQVVEVYWEPGAHRGWFVIEADDPTGVHDVIGVMVESSTNVVRCVLDLETLLRLDKEAS